MKEIGRRLATLEGKIAVFHEASAQDRRDIWNHVEKIREDVGEMKSLHGTLLEVKGLVLAANEKIGHLERKDAVSQGQRNAIVGVAGFVAAAVGAVALWFVRDVLWPLMQTKPH